MQTDTEAVSVKSIKKTISRVWCRSFRDLEILPASTVISEIWPDQFATKLTICN